MNRNIAILSTALDLDKSGFYDLISDIKLFARKLNFKQIKVKLDFLLQNIKV